MKKIDPIGLSTAQSLIDFKGGTGQNQGIPENMSATQLEGSVALHNILAKQGFAYLADEVGMGKTYVALGTVALMRFFNPGLRVAYIAPRENIQEKWTKELRNFSRTNWKSQDHRVRTVQDQPAAHYVRCGSLIDWARHVVRRPNRDVFLRLTSFSFPLAGQSDSWLAKRDEITRLAPMIDRAELDLRDKDTFKDAYARAINTLLPHYDLLIVDEAHNLKAGRAGHSARNRLIEMVLGTAEGQSAPNYRKRFERVLFLSATPLESDFEQLWHQLDLFGVRGPRYATLKDFDATDDEKRALVGEFLVRRLTGLSIGGELHTKNMYRREWRGGGCAAHDGGLTIPDPRQRLIVALVQKKVAEVIQDPRFGASFQMGMLASFESFLQTASIKLASEEDGDSASNFDQSNQTDRQAEREGIDTASVNQIAASYRKTFGHAMPHPKMDAVVDSLTSLFDSGEKALVFVRRVRSVHEITERLCDRHDTWFEALLKEQLDAKHHPELADAWAMYRAQRQSRRSRGSEVQGDPPDADTVGVADDEPPMLFHDPEDEGGSDTFFSWFFRGEGPEGFLSGAAFRKNRFQSEGSVYSAFFEDNHVAHLVGGLDGNMVQRLASLLAVTEEAVDRQLRDLAYAICEHRTNRARLPRFVVYEGYQAAALTLLGDSPAAIAADARTVLLERYPLAAKAPARNAPAEFPGPEEFLPTRTFFTELRGRPELRNELWPEPTSGSFKDRFRAREQRRELLASVARLGHSFVELWALAVNQLETIKLGRRESADDGVEGLIEAFLALLEHQRSNTMAGGVGFHAYRELSLVGQCHELILAVNFPDVVERSLDQLPRLLATTLGRQSPIAGMHGGVSKKAVAQFRMPGYPLVLISTDVLQEGEDLHTFCSKVIHYGISWTPSAMEQRTGRIDRIGSKTHRTLDNLPVIPASETLLQVQYPYLADTVEVLQVERVFERMNRFLRTIHNTSAEQDGDSRVHPNAEFVRERKDIHQIKTPLKSAFEVPGSYLEGPNADVTSAQRKVKEMLSHFDFVVSQLGEEIRVDWEAEDERTQRFGTVYVEGSKLLAADDPRPRGAAGVRQQPFALYLRSGWSGHPLLHGTSPVGIVDRERHSPRSLLRYQSELRGAKVCRLPSKHAGSYTVTVEGDVLLTPRVTDVHDVVDLVARIAIAADRIEHGIFEGRADTAYAVFSDSLKTEATHVAD